MKLQELRIFTEIARTGGVRATAASLNLSQSSVTKALLRLETAFGVQLFTRTNRGLLLTEAGRRLLPGAQGTVANVERTERLAAELRNERAENLRVAIAPTVPDAVVRQALGHFRSRFPKTRLRLSGGLFAEAAPLVLTDEIDLALIIVSGLTRGEVGKLSIENLFTVKYGLVACRTSPFTDRRNATALAGAEWLSTNRRDVAEREIAGVVANLGIPYPERICCCDLHAFRCLILTRNAVSLSPLSILEQQEFSGRLRHLLPDLVRPDALAGAFVSRREAELSAPALYMKHVLRRALSEWLDGHPDSAIQALPFAG